MERGAVFSACGHYRYALWRCWRARGPRLLVVGLNPSTADARVDDPTSRRCIGFARQWHYGALWLANLYAWCSPHPDALWRQPDPIGPLNDSWLGCLARDCDGILVAWGRMGQRNARDREVLNGALAGYRLSCLGRCRNGSPRHPLYLPESVAPLPFHSDNEN
ncbi:DUF1643 domain-containing protein [Marinobacter hydrocarbonoclasticus]|nr:DUF1643 domain-containing protein [Marinobacter nauticus]